MFTKPFGKPIVMKVLEFGFIAFLGTFYIVFLDASKDSH
jgi:hypothetical protein